MKRILALLTLVPGLALAAPTPTAHVEWNFTGTSGASGSLSLPDGGGGDVVLVVFGNQPDGATTLSFTDSGSHTWTRCSSSNTSGAVIFTAPHSGGTGTITVTASSSTSSGKKQIATVWTGVDPSALTNCGIKSLATAQSGASVTATLTGPSSTLVAFLENFSGAALTASAGATLIVSWQPGGNSESAYYLTTPNTGSQTITGTWSVTSDYDGAWIELRSKCTSRAMTLGGFFGGCY